MAKNRQRLLMVLVMLLLVFWGKSYAAGSSQEVAVVTGTNLNIRSGPGTNYSIVAKAVKGNKLPVLEKRNDWYKVAAPGGKQGWVAGWLVKIEKVSQPTSQNSSQSGVGSSGTSGAVSSVQKQVIITGSIINVRSGPGTNFSQVARLTKDDKVEFIRQQNDWYEVRLPGNKTGWVAAWLSRLEILQVKQPEVSKAAADKPAGSLPPGGAISGKVMVTAFNVNIRSGPGTNYEQIGQVQQGQELPIMGQQGDWYQVQLVGGKAGWIAGWLVEVKSVAEYKENINSSTAQEPAGSNPPEVTVIERIALITADIVNVRSGAGTGFQIVSKVKQGDKLVVIGTESDWLQLDLGKGERGWIAGWLAEVREIRAEELVADRGEPKPISDMEAGGDRPSDIGLDLIPGASQPAAGNPENVHIPEHLGLINHISFQAMEKGGQVIIKSDKPMVGYNLFALREPNRIVLDIEQVFSVLQEKQYLFDRKPLTGVRVGQFSPEQVRVVFDLAESAAYAAQLSADRKELRVNVTTSPAVLDSKVIVLDPGHGSINSLGINDPGAIGPSGLMERDVVIDIAHELKKMLEEKGATVVMTRAGNSTNLSLEGRAEAANNLGADIFVSIHANSSLSSLQNGTSVFYYAPLDNEFGSQRNARRLLAQSIQSELVNELKLRDMGIIEKNFAVLRHTTMPSALVEVAYISNPAEEKLLANAAFRKRTAEGIMKGIMQYFFAIK